MCHISDTLHSMMIMLVCLSACLSQSWAKSTRLVSSNILQHFITCFFSFLTSNNEQTRSRGGH